MTHIVVVGAGIAGSSVARAARRAGIRVTVVAEGREHSRAAAALLRAAYHVKRPGEPALYERSVALYGEWGVPLDARGGWVTNYRTPDREPRYDPDWLLLDPAAPLVTPDRSGHARPTARGVRVGTLDVDADTVVWCTGAATGSSLTYGVTWVHPDPAALTAPDRLRIHHIAPYKTIAAGTAGGVARLGSSSARDAELADEQGRRMLAAAAQVGIIHSLTGWVPIRGQRCTASVPVAAPGGIHQSLNDLHRTGYALAPALGERIAANAGRLRHRVS